MLCNLLVAETAAACTSVQEAARPYGVLLWQLNRCIALILKLRQVPIGEEDHDMQSEVEAVDEPAEYPMLSENIPAIPEGLLSAPIACPSLHYALAIAEDSLVLLCSGSTTNSGVILRALPDAMTLYLVHKQRKTSSKEAASSRMDRFRYYQEKMSRYEKFQ